MTEHTAFTFPNIDFDTRQVDDLPVIWVDTPATLAQLVDEIDEVEVVGLDTEFIKRTTYYPILALVQVNTGKAIYLVDAPKLDLSQFWQALSEVPTMVWYACGEDLGIFYLLAKCPPLTNVFDVQIGVAYLTGILQSGYSQAIGEILGISLDKGESQSDWLARPLSEEQRNYAINDVKYLLALYEVVKDTLQQRGILACASEDALSYAKELHTLHNTPDDQLYLDLVAPLYTRRQLALLQQLVIWREQLARAINEPKTFILGKQALREIIQDEPSSIKNLAKTTINRGTLRRYGDEIVRIVHQVAQMPEDKLPPLPAPTYHSKDKPFKNALHQAIDKYSQAHLIPANLLLKNRWINQLLLLVAYDGDLQELPIELQGYRHDWIVQTIMPLLGNYKEQILQVFQTPQA